MTAALSWSRSQGVGCASASSDSQFSTDRNLNYPFEPYVSIIRGFLLDSKDGSEDQYDPFELLGSTIEKPTGSPTKARCRLKKMRLVLVCIVLFRWSRLDREVLRVLSLVLIPYSSTMVQIEYAPNSRSKCKGCFGKIPVGNVRVSAKEQAHRGRGYVNKYFHGECYTGRKDFTKFYGFTNLRVEDQTRFLSEAQKKRLCPAPETDQASSSSQQPPAKKAKTAALPVAATPAPNPKVLPPVNGTKMGGDYLFTIVGRKYSTETITPGRSVKLTREPNNVSL